MHPYRGSPRCPRCEKSVYAAEQVMGPGRRLYHKGCLTCYDCNKRLDSLSLVEHDEEPYCKNCHSKNFGTRDLRQANLPHRGDLQPLSPTRTGSFPPVPPLSPTLDGEAEEARPVPTVTMTLGRRVGTPLAQTPTGTRYGAGLGGASASPLRATPTGSARWGGGTPQCPKCGKSVYFAEQVKAVGKTWHKTCLRCTECGTSLDATRLTEKDGIPHCHRCYNKLHGPAGHGYALLGKAGG
ncbi:hypothetical protein K488DRAFT_47564 [Vararia minispora EC-137]|uniref:Uncharacterized protein n=1 Tax=Vararia minispora EC-137 TaxID=1314806 RepID=A0ACB8QPB9_9AGAM|nr:hypothetical protein K488DRAFT_47564 [Vararia minispora EC-137]